VSNIYQQIWNSDRHKFSVSPRDNNGGWLNPDANILLDEQVKASGRQDLDLASKPLF
jgi:poly(U)-specific endoribonuclease